jgi:hypothetical protein
LSTAGLLGGLALANTAGAIPGLQLYLEGATYDTGSETWVLTTTDPFKLWVIGNINGPGGVGTISDVKLSIAYASGLSPTFTLTPTTTGGLGGFFDPSTPADAAFSKTVTDGSSPILGDGSSLPSHGIYGAGTSWTEYILGDFTLQDSPMADFVTAFPSAPAAATGQINVYEILVTGVAEGTSFHFDTYDHIVGGGGNLRYINAPFSHDAGGTDSTDGTDTTDITIPEPNGLGLLGAALLAAGLIRRRAKRA